MAILSQYTDPLVQKATGGIMNFLGQSFQSAKQGLSQSALGDVYRGYKNTISTIGDYYLNKSTTPVTVTPQQQVAGSTLGSTNNQNNNIPPTVNANTSDVNAQISSMLAQAKNIQAQLDEYKKQQEATPPPSTTPPPEEQSSMEKMWATLTGQQAQVQQQIQQSQQDLMQQQKDIYAQWGLTPENYQKIQGLTAQIADYQKQMAAIDEREAMALDTIANRPGIDLAFMSGEQARISRAYAIQKSGVAAQASILTSQAQALSNNWDDAFKSAQLYVDNATLAQKQLVSDLKWGFDNYKDIISAMTKQEQDQINQAYKMQQDELDRQETNYWKELDYNLKQQGLDLDYAKYNLDVAEKLGLGSGYTPGAPIAPQQEASTIRSLVTKLPVAQQEGAYGAIASFKNAKDIIDLIEGGVKTGAVQGRIGGIAQFFGTSSPEFDRLQSAMTAFAANFIKGISGVAVSEKEFIRLSKALPSVNKQEGVNINTLKELLNTMKNKWQTQTGINFDDFPTEIPQIGSGATTGDYESYLNAIK